MDFYYSQLFITPPYPKTDYTNQTVIVTGSNVGLGFEAARHFVRLNAAKVIIAVRSVEKGEAAKRDIETATNRTNVIEVWQLDLSHYASVKAFAAKVAGLPRVDVVLENAGIAVPTFEEAEQDEITITVNVVSTFLLALLVLPTLRRSAKEHRTTPRLTIVSSEVHGWTNLPEWKADNTFRKLSDKDTANMTDRYPASKLMEVFGIREIAKRSPTSTVVVNTVNPGLCHSDLARNVQSWKLNLMKTILARTTEVGSRTLVHAASAGKETHGKYLSNCKITEPSEFVRSDDGQKAQEKVWKELCDKLESIQPGILANL